MQKEKKRKKKETDKGGKSEIERNDFNANFIVNTSAELPGLLEAIHQQSMSSSRF